MNRIYHHWELWECYKAGFYSTTPPAGMTKDKCVNAYCKFLADLPRFEKALNKVLIEWPNSCDQFLSNENINRVAWLGQSSMCIDSGISSNFRAGFKLLTPKQQRLANLMAEKYLKIWLKKKGDNEKSDGVYRSMETMRLF